MIRWTIFVTEKVHSIYYYFSMIIFPGLTKAFLCDAFLENLKLFFGKFPRLKSQNCVKYTAPAFQQKTYTPTQSE